MLKEEQKSMSTDTVSGGLGVPIDVACSVLCCCCVIGCGQFKIKIRPQIQALGLAGHNFLAQLEVQLDMCTSPVLRSKKELFYTYCIF